MKEEKEREILDNIFLVLSSLFLHKLPIKGRTRFQKTVFLLKRKYGIPFDFKFVPYYYGPYSEELAELISFLLALRLVKETTEYFGVGVVRYNYELTEKGKEYFAIFKKNAKRETLRAIQKLENKISKINTLSTPDLILESKSLMRTRVNATVTP